MIAAGMAGSRGQEVTLFEKNEKLGKKLFITGKGRCNITIRQQYIVAEPVFILFLIFSGKHLLGGRSEFHKISLDEIVYLAVHDTLHIGGLVAGAVVLDTAVVEYVTAYL